MIPVIRVRLLPSLRSLSAVFLLGLPWPMPSRCFGQLHQGAQARRNYRRKADKAANESEREQLIADDLVDKMKEAKTKWVEERSQP
jgi:hypothetical protein